MIFKETKRQLDSILTAFSKYIQEQNNFDIVYSEKAGYLWILAQRPEEAEVRRRVAVILQAAAAEADACFRYLDRYLRDYRARAAAL